MGRMKSTAPLPADDLFSQHGGVRRADPQSSADGAATVNVNKIGNEILVALRSQFGSEGATAEQVAAAINRNQQSITPRFVELERAKKIYRIRTGTSKTGRATYQRRKNASGVGSTIWYFGQRL